MQRQVLAFTRASVADRPEVEFCVDLAAHDVVAEWLLDQHRIDEPIMRAFLGLIEPGMRVLDLGCHIGTFSLPASKLGAHVIALDASPQHVNLMRHSARRNGFDELEVVHGAITASEDPVEFIELSIHSHIQQHAEDGADTVQVPAVRVDELVRERGWDGVDAIKMDVEGNELNALAGMRELFVSGARPAIVFECNGGMLPGYGASICVLRETLVGLGYELFLIDHLRPGLLVQASADGIQPESASDYLALASRPADLAERWRIDPPFTLEQTVVRLLDAAGGDAAGYRCYCAETIAGGPQWLRSQPLLAAGFSALQLDHDGAVRARCDLDNAYSPALAHAGAPEPARDSPPSDVVVWASGLHVEQPGEEPDLPPGIERGGGSGSCLLEDVSFHVRAGELLAVRIAPDAGSLLLNTLAGLCPPRVGELHVEGPVVLISALGDGMEQELTVAENFLLYGAFLGCHVPELSRRMDQLAGLARAAEWLGSALRDAPPALAVRIALTVALECAQPRLLLLDRLAPCEDDAFARWASEQASSRAVGGLAVVQLLDDAERALRPPNRALWIERRMVRACGHPRSVFDAAWRSRFDVDAHGRRLAARRPAVRL
jgi:FkbM family methyltransferase